MVCGDGALRAARSKSGKSPLREGGADIRRGRRFGCVFAVFRANFGHHHLGPTNRSRRTTGEFLAMIQSRGAVAAYQLRWARLDHVNAS